MKGVLVGVLVVLVLGCTMKPTEVTAPMPTTTTASPTTTIAQATSVPPANPVAHVGATLTLQDSEIGKLAVAVAKIIDPATGQNQFLIPSVGNRFVAVQLSLQNQGPDPIQGDPLNDVTIVDAAHQEYRADFSPVSQCHSLTSLVTLGPGETTTGCAVFLVPKAATVTLVKFVPLSGFGSTFGEWLVP